MVGIVLVVILSVGLVRRLALQGRKGGPESGPPRIHASQGERVMRMQSEARRRSLAIVAVLVGGAMSVVGCSGSGGAATRTGNASGELVWGQSDWGSRDWSN